MGDVFRSFRPALLPLVLVGLLMGGLLVGFEPVGGDPDRLYRPLKQELSRSLSAASLPFWTDRLGVGIPLVAESHVAAYYPPNWPLYAVGPVPVAYRLAMFIHYVFLAAATYAYARFLRISTAGSGLAALGFTFCGFQAIHSSHEPFYHILPYLPLAILLGEWYLASGCRLALWLLAMAWAAQLTLGHFQLQMWTAGLVLFVGLGRVLFDGRPVGRLPALALSLAAGAALASVQLLPSWELARFVGSTRRTFAELAFYGFPAAHWAEAAVPGFVRGIQGGPEAPYWYSLGTTGYEACLYVGTLPLLLAVAGLAGKLDRTRVPWLLVAAITLLLAALPTSWPAGYALVLQCPGLGWFRAPGRYLALTSLALSLEAGRGMDTLGRAGPYARRLVFAWTFALAAVGWVVYWSLRPDHRAALGQPARLAGCLAAAGVSWLVFTLLVVAWRRGKLGAWVLLAATAGELGWLYYTSTTVWGWAVDLPRQSKVLARLAEESDVRHVAGLLHDLPVRAGVSPIFPATGFAPPPPHPAFELATRYAEANAAIGLARFRRYGVTHGVWDGPVRQKGVTTLFEGEDPVLDRLVFKPPGAPSKAVWRIVRYPEPFPEARAAIHIRRASDERSLLSGASFDADPESVWYGPGDEPPAASRPWARAARVTSWDGRIALVEHDGPCDLVINRTYYPGWTAVVNDGPPRAVSRAEIGIQSVRLDGAGPSRVVLEYRPTNQALAQRVSIGMAIVLLGGLGYELARLRRRRSNGAAASQQN